MTAHTSQQQQTLIDTILLVNDPVLAESLADCCYMTTTVLYVWSALRALLHCDCIMLNAEEESHREVGGRPNMYRKLQRRS